MNVILFVREITFPSFSFLFSRVLKFVRSTELKGKVCKEKKERTEERKLDRRGLKNKKEVYLTTFIIVGLRIVQVIGSSLD